jgi:hypothetical protein
MQHDIGGATLEVGKHRVEGGQVAVDIREDRYPHASAPRAHITPSLIHQQTPNAVGDADRLLAALGLDGDTRK